MKSCLGGGMHLNMGRMQLMRLKLGFKIGGGFGILILVVLMLGGLAVYNMEKIKKQSDVLAKEYMPASDRISDVQGAMFLLAYNARGYFYTNEDIIIDYVTKFPIILTLIMIAIYVDPQRIINHATSLKKNSDRQ